MPTTIDIECSVPGCGRAPKGFGYCNPHYLRWRRTGDPGGAQVRSVTRGKYDGCSVAGCMAAHEAYGYCKSHYSRWRRTGDPTSPGTRLLEVVSYAGVHARVHRARGGAADYPCRECGRPADQWAYTNDDPAELVDVDGRRYSLDVERYIPMCTSCHARFDRGGGGPTCRRGHAFMPGNVGWHKRGTRFCRACNRGLMRVHYWAERGVQLDVQTESDRCYAEIDPKA